METTKTHIPHFHFGSPLFTRIIEDSRFFMKRTFFSLNCPFFELGFQNNIKRPEEDSLSTVETSSTKIKTMQSVHIPEKDNGEICSHLEKKDFRNFLFVAKTTPSAYRKTFCLFLVFTQSQETQKIIDIATMLESQTKEIIKIFLLRVLQHGRHDVR